MAGKIQKQDVKTETELTGAGATKADLINDTQIYVSVNGINKTLDDAIADGDIGSASTINYIPYPKAENGVGTWVVSKNTSAAATPDNGFVTSGVTNTFVVSATTPLRGANSFLATLAALGNQYYIPFTIDSADKAKAIRGFFEYSIASGTFADDSLTVNVYDVTNGVFLPCTPSKIKNSTTIERFGFEFQSSYNSTSYRLVLHQAIASTAALRLDNFSLGPNPLFYGSAITDLVSTPVPSTAITNATRDSYFWKKIGDEILIQAGWTFTGAGAMTGMLATQFLPSGLSIDTAKLGAYLAGGSDDQVNIGTFDAIDNGVLSYRGAVTYNKTAGTINLYQPASGTGIFTPGNTDGFSVTIRLPVLGWSSSQIFSTDADTRIVAALYNGTPTGTINGSTDNVFPTKVVDTHGSYASGIYTIAVQGYYDIAVAGFIQITTGSFTSLSILQNATTLVFKQLPFPSNFTNQISTEASIKGVFFNVGDTIKTRFNANGSPTFNSTTGANYFSITKVNGPAQIAASESTNFRGANTAGTSISNSGDIVVPFATTSFASHGNWDGVNTYTINTPGKYRVQAEIWFASALYAIANRLFASIQKNAAIVSYGNVNYLHSAATGIFTCSVDDVLNLLPGDTIKISVNNNRTAGATSLDTGAGENFVSITKVSDL